MRSAIQLPESAATKLIAFEDDAAAAEAAARDAAQRLSQLPADADPRLVERLHHRRGEASNKHAELAALVNNIKTWLNKVRGMLEVVEPASVKLEPGQGIATTVEHTRDQIGALQSRLQNISTAPLPKAEDKRRAADEVAERVKRGRPRYDSRPDRLVIDHIDAQRMDFASVINDCLDKMAWFSPDLFLAAYTRDLDEMPQRADALSPDERTRRMAELSAQLETLERSEENLIEQAQAQGIEIARREDADPKCVLGLRLQQRRAAAVA
jgi:hypothetical protein